MPTVKRAADQATSRFQSVPLKLKTAPRKRKSRGLLEASEAMNCGKNARKNRATFGFSTFVRKPWTNTVRKVAGGTPNTPPPRREEREGGEKERNTHHQEGAPP